MELCYFNSEKGNFGDDLNPYILKSLIPGYEQLQDNSILYFIGTILYNGFVGEEKIIDFNKRRKIVLGSGLRYLNEPPKIDLTWDVRFLRGPLSSLTLFNNCSSFITDPAYLICKTPVFQSLPTKKKYRISIMPHLFSVEKLNWKNLCHQHGINFINPSEKNIPFILSEIAQSEVLITEAMHGAIIADALRVPWKRFKYTSHIFEREIVSEFKWSDWLLSMNLNQVSFKLNYHRIIREIDKRSNLQCLKYLRKQHVEASFDELIKGSGYQLSKDSVLEEKLERLLAEIDLLNRQITRDGF